jgi:hypothetical protein
MIKWLIGYECKISLRASGSKIIDCMVGARGMIEARDIAIEALKKEFPELSLRDVFINIRDAFTAVMVEK